MKSITKTRIILLAGIAVLAALDQWVKHWARTVLFYQSAQPIVEGVLGFRFATNDGAAFGILGGARWFFVVFTFVALTLIVLYERLMPHDRKYLWMRIPLAFIVAGGIGNLIDRIRTGYVVDMFEFLFIRFAIFNVADIFLVGGTLVFCIAMLILVKDEPKNVKRNREPQA